MGLVHPESHVEDRDGRWTAACLFTVAPFDAVVGCVLLLQEVGQGWTDVHDDKGCRADPTWPTDGLPFPVMRLDHILVTDDLEVLSTEMGDPGGSDPSGDKPNSIRRRLTVGPVGRVGSG